MYYSEKVIDGVLCWRGTPNGAWTQFTAKALTERLAALAEQTGGQQG